MTGKLCTILMPYYDAQNEKMSVKARPALVIGTADADDLTVLPVSRVTDSRRINGTYDIRVDPSEYPNTNLKAVSYIRTNKVYTANRKDVGNIICDLNAEYPELCKNVILLFDEYVADIKRNWT